MAVTNRRPAGVPFAHVLWALPAAALLLVCAAALNAGAATSEVRLAGDNGPNFFFVHGVSATQLEFCSDTVPCFTRLRSEVGSVVVDAFNGDDLLVVSHGSGFVTNGDQDLPISFIAGTGADDLAICDDVPDACTAAATTEVLPGPEPDEMRVIQCAGRFHEDGRCEADWEARGSTLRITARGATRIRDLTPGPTTVVGSAGDDVATLRSTDLVDMSGNPLPAGEVLVGSSAPYVFAGKDSLGVDVGAGTDRIVTESVAGLATLPRNCAPAGRPTASVCLRGDAASHDALTVAAAPSSPEAVAIDPHQGGATLTGPAAAPRVALTGIDGIALAQQPGAGDRLTVRGTAGDDATDVRTGAAKLTITGQLDRAGAAFALPELTVAGDGSGPLALHLEGLGGDDQVAHAGTSADETMAFGPAGTGFSCPPLPTDCLQVSVNGSTHHTLTTDDVGRFDLDSGDGDDALTAHADRAPALTWRGGSGSDALTFTGTGQPLTLDLEAGTLQQTGGGVVTATAIESLTADAAGRNLTVVGTAGADHLRYRPADATRGLILLDGDPRLVHARNVAGTLVVDPAAGADGVTVEATGASETIAITRGTAVVTQVADTLPLRVPASGEAIAVAAGAGDDRFIVSGEGGPSAITLDGGTHTGGDRISFAAALADATVALGATPGTGTLEAGGPAIAFLALEHVDVEGDDGGTVTVLGSDTDDALVQSSNTVTAGRGTTIAYARYATLAIAAGAGNDEVWLKPASTSAEIRVDGGTTGANSVLVFGTALGEAITYQPSGPAAARLHLGGAPPVTMVGTQQVRVDGGTSVPSGDTLTYTTPTIVGTVVAEPGATFDAGVLRMRDASGQATAVPPLQYSGLGTGRVEIDGHEPGSVPADALVMAGEPDADVFVVGTSAAASGPAMSVRLDTRLPVSLPGMRTLQLEGADGPDTFRVPANHLLPGAGGSGVLVDGGATGNGDTLAVTVAGDPVSADLPGGTVAQSGHRPVAFTGVARVELDAGGEPLTLLGSAGPDDLSYQPTGASGGDASASGTTAVVAIDRAATLTIDPRAGADRVTVTGRATDDAIAVDRATVTTVTVGALLPARIGEAAEALRVEGREGADEMTVTGAGGPASLTLAGGGPALDGDVLRVHSPQVEVAYATDPTAGSLSTPGGPVAFTSMDVVDVTGDETGSLTVRGTDGPDTLTIGDPDVPRVRVNGGAPVAYRGYRDVVLEGAGGLDRTSVAYARLGDIDRLRVVGGTAADDEVVITDTAGTTRRFTVHPTAPDSAVVTSAGLPELDFTGAASLSVNGRVGDDEVLVVTPDGAQDAVVETGPTVDSGGVRVASLVPVHFTNIGVDGRLTINDASMPADDRVVLPATAEANTFEVLGSASQVRLTGFVRLVAHGTAELALLGRDGSDTFRLTGPLPWPATTVDGGGPDQGDRLELDGPVGDVTVDLGAQSLSGYGGMVRFPEIRGLHTHLDARTLRHVGTSRDDGYCYDPMAPRDGRLHVVGAPAGGTLASVCLPDARALAVLHTFVDVGRFVIDPVDGVDQVIVNGTAAADVLSVTSTAPNSIVSLNPDPQNTDALRLPVEVVSAATENVSLAADEGSDIIDVSVHEHAAPLFTVYGEGPTTARSGDVLHVRDLTGGARLRAVRQQGGPTGSGTVTVDYWKHSGTIVRVDYAGIEEVNTYTRKR